MKTYQVVDYNGRFAVQNVNDNVLLKSKESSSVISFKTIIEAEKLRDIFQGHIDQIKNAGRYWFIKESATGSSKGYVMRKVEAKL